MRIRRWRRRDLAERIAPYVQPIEPREPMVPADPIRMFLVRWMIETGDPIEVVATGFNLDVRLVRALLTRVTESLPRVDFLLVSRQLGIDEKPNPDCY